MDSIKEKIKEMSKEDAINEIFEIVRNVQETQKSTPHYIDKTQPIITLDKNYSDKVKVVNYSDYAG